MNKHGIMGTIKDKVGTLEEGFGALTGGKETQLRGQARQLEGQVEGLLGTVIAEARAFYRAHPVVSLLAIASAALAVIPALKGNR
jgi:uncharacterized protein YjbJ (UPF0337 family)